VLADQRSRLQGAMIELVGERGYRRVTVRSLSRTAGVSTRTFYKHFDNVEACFATTSEELMQCALRRTAAAMEESAGYEQRVRDGLRVLLEAIAAHPKAAHLVLIDSFAAGAPLLMQMRRAFDEFERLLTVTFAAPPEETSVPPRIVQGMVAGATRVVRTRLLVGEARELPDLAGELGDWMLSLCDAYVVERAVDSRAMRSRGEPPEEQRNGHAALLAAARDERRRIFTAVTKLGMNHGYEALTISGIRIEAGVSRRGFDAQFASMDECFLEAIEALAAAAGARAERRAIGAGSWERGVYLAAVTLCSEVARTPSLAQLSFIDILAPGRVGLQRRERLVAKAADRLRHLAPAERRPSELAAEASVAAAWKIIQAEIADGNGDDLLDIAPTIAYALVAPTAGAAKAASAIGVE
jgi:AcrR family transcriptional regulator